MKTKAVIGIRKKLFRRVLYNYKINLTPKLTCGGEFAILSSEIGVLEIYQIEVIRLWLAKQLKPYYVKVFVRSVFALPFTQKAKQARMGKGKGKIKHFFCRVDMNDVLFEIRKPTEKELKSLRKRGIVVLDLDRRTIERLVEKIQYRFSLPLVIFPYKHGVCRNEVINNR